MPRMPIFAEWLAQRFGATYSLTYRCMVNLEGTINNMLQDGLSDSQVINFLDDIYSNLEVVLSLGEAPVKLPYDETSDPALNKDGK